MLNAQDTGENKHKLISVRYFVVRLHWIEQWERIVSRRTGRTLCHVARRLGCESPHLGATVSDPHPVVKTRRKSDCFLLVPLYTEEQPEKIYLLAIKTNIIEWMTVSPGQNKHVH